MPSSLSEGCTGKLLQPPEKGRNTVKTAGGIHACTSVLRDKRILLAEDEPEVRGMLRRVFEAHDYVVSEAENGRKAAEIARRCPADLVVADLWMPVMNGVELIEALDAMHSPAEVIVLSAHMTSATTQKLRGLGVFRMLRKPIGVETLLGAARAGLKSDRRGRLAGELARSLRPGAESVCPQRALVLVADDDDEVRGLLLELLTSAGYRVEEARDGKEAVEKTLAHDVSLVLIDLNMPRMNGQKAVEALRRTSRDCPIICMTGESSQREIDAVLRAGAVSCHRKPFDLGVLLREIERLEIITLHRRRVAERRRAREGSLVPLARSVQRSRCPRRMVLATIAAVVLFTAAASIISTWITAAAGAARTAADRAGKAVDSASRIEGYLQRDEARELMGNRY